MKSHNKTYTAKYLLNRCTSKRKNNYTGMAKNTCSGNGIFYIYSVCVLISVYLLNDCLLNQQLS